MQLDERVSKILSTLKTREKEINNQLKEIKWTYKTNQRFSFQLGTPNVQHLSSMWLEFLYSSHAFLSGFQGKYKDLAKWNWYLVSDWIYDIENVILKEELVVTLKEITDWIKSAEKYLSQDAKANQELLELEKSFSI